MNRDEGAYQLSPIWTQVISTPPTRGGGGASTEWLCAFIAIINTFRSLFKASDTFDDFQVLIKIADSHWNLSAYASLRIFLAMFWEHLNRQRMHCFRTNTWYRTKDPLAVCVLVSPVLIPSSTNRRVDSFASLASYAYSCRICPQEFLLPASKKKQ